MSEIKYLGNEMIITGAFVKDGQSYDIVLESSEVCLEQRQANFASDIAGRVKEVWKTSMGLLESVKGDVEFRWSNNRTIVQGGRCARKNELNEQMRNLYTQLVLTQVVDVPAPTASATPTPPAPATVSITPVPPPATAAASTVAPAPALAAPGSTASIVSVGLPPEPSPAPAPASVTPTPPSIAPVPAQPAQPLSDLEHMQQAFAAAEKTHRKKFDKFQEVDFYSSLGPAIEKLLTSDNKDNEVIQFLLEFEKEIKARVDEKKRAVSRELALNYFCGKSGTTITETEFKTHNKFKTTALKLMRLHDRD